MKRVNTWLKKVYHAGNTRIGCFVMGTFLGLLSWVTYSMRSINLGEPVIIAFLYGIPFGVIYATPLFFTGIVRYSKSR